MTCHFTYLSEEKACKYSVQDIHDDLNEFRIFVGYKCVIITLFFRVLMITFFTLIRLFFFFFQYSLAPTEPCLECIILHPVVLSGRGLSLTTVGETQLKQREEKNKINHTRAHFLPTMPRRLNLSRGVLMLGLRGKKKEKKKSD